MFVSAVLVVLCYLVQGTLPVHILSLEVPAHVQLGSTAVLTCNYELGQDELYSVKWYKGKDEFYRYIPKDHPPGQVFRLNGVQVNQIASNNHQVVLENVGLATSGKYRCEVSAEAPSFQTVSQFKEMMIVDPPDEGPTISGGQAKYRIGDFVRVNCTTTRSSPAAMLEWFVNDEKVHDGLLRMYPIIKDQDGLESSILGLEFQVSEHHFENGGLILRCVASIHPFYTVSNEQSINSEQRTASILGSHGNLNHVEDNVARTSIAVSLCLSSIVLVWFIR